MTRRALPTELYDAYNWTDAAGELPTLRTLEGAALETYCAESEANALAHGGDVDASDLMDLHRWLNETQ